ncbi:hypothetical protein EB72_04535 [Mycobacterium sp. SWH-M1]|nr:hypothetical protein EB72_04535 [Mycobacterium sp. SWH-M1]
MKSDIQQTTDQYNQTIRQVADIQADPTKSAVGQNADGSINTATENAHNLYQALKDIKSSTEGVAGANGDVNAVLSRFDEPLTQPAPGQAQNDETEKTSRGGGMDASSFGQTLVSGIFESFGLPNFSNLPEWPNVQSAFAIANWATGLLTPPATTAIPPARATVAAAVICSVAA